jgi:hypothetical protein
MEGTKDGQMKQARFTEEQIIGILPEQEAVKARICRKRGAGMTLPGAGFDRDRHILIVEI